MEYRKVTIFSGKRFEVPNHIQRLDERSMHGWQVRYGNGKHKLFSDHSNDGSGASASLRAAKKELAKRIAKLAAPTGLRTDTASWKANDLPVGISGPAEVIRKGRKVIEYYYQVTYPVVGRTPVNRKIYIGTENTYTEEKREAALARAVSIRDTNVKKYKAASTQWKRAQAIKAGLHPPGDT